MAIRNLECFTRPRHFIRDDKRLNSHDIILHTPLTCDASDPSHGWVTQVIFWAGWELDDQSRMVAEIKRWTTRVKGGRRQLKYNPQLYTKVSLWDGGASPRALGSDLFYWHPTFGRSPIRGNRPLLDLDAITFDPADLYAFFPGLVAGGAVNPLVDWLGEHEAFRPWLFGCGVLPKNVLEANAMMRDWAIEATQRRNASITQAEAEAEANVEDALRETEDTDRWR